MLTVRGTTHIGRHTRPLGLLTPNEAEWSIKDRAQQRGDVEPTIQVARQSVRGGLRLFYLNIGAELRK